MKSSASAVLQEARAVVDKIAEARGLQVRRTISSQRYLDPKIVESKRAHGDYAAQRVSIEIDGELLYVVIDGHHSIAAAKADGVAVEWELAHPEIQRAADAAVRAGAAAVSNWFEQHQGDSDWYDVATGRDAW